MNFLPLIGCCVAIQAGLQYRAFAITSNVCITQVRHTITTVSGVPSIMFIHGSRSSFNRPINSFDILLAATEGRVPSYLLFELIWTLFEVTCIFPRFKSFFFNLFSGSLPLSCTWFILKSSWNLSGVHPPHRNVWVYGFGGLECWNGMVEWIGQDWTGIEWWASELWP